MGSLCNFEEGLCGWQTDDFWRRHSGSTPTALTGPSSDHTLQTPNGKQSNTNQKNLYQTFIILYHY